MPSSIAGTAGGTSLTRMLSQFPAPGHAPSRIYGTPTTMLWVYRLGLETEEAYRRFDSFEGKGFRQVIREPDASWQDYGEKPEAGLCRSGCLINSSRFFTCLEGR
jgi:hypothetical protein